MWNAGLDEVQTGIKIAGRNIYNLRYADDNNVMAESEEKLKSLLMKVKDDWKNWLKTQHSKVKIMASGSHHFMTNRCRNNGHSEKLYFLGFQNHCR